MKTKRIDIRTSETDNLTLQKASEILQEQTGKKQNASKTIRAAVQQLAENKLELFFVNRPAIRAVDTNVQMGQKNLQNFIDEFLKVTGKQIALDECEKLFGYGRNFGVCNKTGLRELVLDKLIKGKSTSVAGVQLNETKLKEIVHVPDLETLFKLADKVFDVNMVNYRDVFFWQAYRFENDKIIIILEAVEQIKNSYRVFAETPHEKLKLSRVRNLCEALNKLLENEVVNPERFNILGVTYFDDESNRFEPAEIFVKYNL